MGRRLTQRIYECDICGKVPEDGEHMWHMGQEIWCEDCCNKEEPEKETKESGQHGEADWIRKQGKCCICSEEPTHADNMDNVFCDDCAERDKEESPENWG